MSEQKERESSKCKQCGETIYWFYSKKHGKKYPCSSNQFDDFHNCKKKDGGNTATIRNESTIENKVAPLNTDQTLFSLMQALGKLAIDAENILAIHHKELDELRKHTIELEKQTMILERLRDRE